MTDQKAAEPKPAMPLPAHAISLPEEIDYANLTEKLLNAQLAEVLSMIRDAGYIYRNCGLPMDHRAVIVGHATDMMSASAKLTDRILRLRGAETVDKRIHYVVEHREGEGVARNEKRMPAGHRNANGNGRTKGDGQSHANASANGHAEGNGLAGANGHANGNGLAGANGHANGNGQSHT